MAADDRVVRMAEIEVHPDQVEAYSSLLKEEIEASIADEPGVLMLHAVSLNGHPERICILEVYASQRDYEAHLQAPHFLKYKTLTAGMVKSLALAEADPVAMCAK